MRKLEKSIFGKMRKRKLCRLLRQKKYILTILVHVAVVRNIRSVVGKIDKFGKVADIIPIKFFNKGRRTPGNGFVCPFFGYAICKKM